MDKFDNISTEISGIKKENPFKVPKNYFNDFSARLQVKIEAEKKEVPKQQNRIIQFLKPALGLAASFTLIFMLVYWPLKTFVPSTQEISSNLQQDLTEIELLNVVEEMDETSFFTLLGEPDSKGIEFTDEDLLAYVSANISDYELYTGSEN